MTIHDAMPRRGAAHASAAPWFPEECVTTPFAAPASLSESTALHAPRALNAATFWRFSHLKKSVAPVAMSSERLVSTGVHCTCAAMRACAARIFSRSTSIAGSTVAAAVIAQLPGNDSALGKNRSFHVSGLTLIEPVLNMKSTYFMMFCGVVVNTI